MSGDLERRYRRALRLLPGYYRQQWEEDMVAAFLDSSLTGDPEEDELIIEYGRPSVPELASVAGLAARLYLGGAGAPRQYFTWGQAVRDAVLVVTLARATQALGSFAVAVWEHRAFGLFAPPAPLVAATGGGIWLATWYAVGYAWIVAYIALVLGHYRTAQGLAVLAIAPDLVYLLRYPGVVGLVDSVRPGPGAGHGRFPRRRPAGGAAQLAFGAAGQLRAGGGAGDSPPGLR
jgi:hypothetical protein